MPWEDVLQKILAEIALKHILIGIIIIILTNLSIRALNQTAHHLEKKFPPERVMIRGALPFVKFLGYLIGLFSLLHFAFGLSREVILGISASSILVLGFALKDTVASMASGVLFLLDRPFQVGDIISFDNMTGEVIDMGFRSVKISPLIGRMIVIPNYRLFNASITVLGGNRKGIVTTVDLYLPLNGDLNKAREILKEAALKNSLVETRQPIFTYVSQALSGSIFYIITLQCTIKHITMEKIFQATMLSEAHEALSFSSPPLSSNTELIPPLREDQEKKG